ncbi:hypothetical protein PSPO01_09737 [Paraphaeosphaeria sporulosa]
MKVLRMTGSTHMPLPIITPTLSTTKRRTIPVTTTASQSLTMHGTCHTRSAMRLRALILSIPASCAHKSRCRLKPQVSQSRRIIWHFKWSHTMGPIAGAGRGDLQDSRQFPEGHGKLSPSGDADVQFTGHATIKDELQNSSSISDACPPVLVWTSLKSWQTPLEMVADGPASKTYCVQVDNLPGQPFQYKVRVGNRRVLDDHIGLRRRSNHECGLEDSQPEVTDDCRFPMVTCRPHGVSTKSTSLLRSNVAVRS